MDYPVEKTNRGKDDWGCGISKDIGEIVCRMYRGSLKKWNF